MFNSFKKTKPIKGSHDVPDRKFHIETFLLKASVQLLSLFSPDHPFPTCLFHFILTNCRFTEFNK